MRVDFFRLASLVAGLAIAPLALSGCTALDTAQEAEPSPTATLVAEYTIEPALELTREEAISKCVTAIKDKYARPIFGSDPEVSSYEAIFGHLAPQVHQDGMNWVVSYSGAEAFSLKCTTQGDQVKISLPGN